MKSKTEDHPTGRRVASIGMLLLVAGVLVILTSQPASPLEPGSGMGNYRMPSGDLSGRGATSSTGAPSSGATASFGNAAIPGPVLVDTLTPANDTNNSL